MELPTRAANTRSAPESETSSSGGKQPRRSAFHTLRDVVVGFLVAVILFLLFEGVCSIALTMKDFIDTPIIAERLHTRYDSELGWSNNPGTYIPDMYGPGVHTN